MAKPLKTQIHSSNLKVWNFRGENDFTSFYPAEILASDVWLCSAAYTTGSLTINPGDLVMAMGDFDYISFPLNQNSVDVGKWKIIRHISQAEKAWIEGQMYTAPELVISGVTSSFLKYGYDTSPAINVGFTVTQHTEVITGIKLERIVSGGVTTIIFEDMSSPALSGNIATTVALNTNTSFKLTVYTATRNFTSTAQSSWLFECFQGVSANTALDEAKLEAILPSYTADNTASINKSGTFNCAGTTDHWFFAVPEEIHPASPDYLEFKIQDLVTTLNTVADVARRIGAGTTLVNYKIYRTPNPGVGAMSFVVTYKNV